MADLSEEEELALSTATMTDANDAPYEPSQPDPDPPTPPPPLFHFLSRPSPAECTVSGRRMTVDDVAIKI